jgi:hypothetical protein
VLSAVLFFVLARFGWRPRGEPRDRGNWARSRGLSRWLTLPVLTVAAGFLARLLGGVVRVGRCESDRDDGERQCTHWQDEGYHVCGRYEDRGYSACRQYEDRGYSACQRYEDRGYNSCREWRRNCCDWWPCSWACEIISWVCFAWVWISNLVCVAWVWISNLVCTAWVWVTSLACVLWVWFSRLVCVAWVWIRFPFCIFWCLLRRLFTGNEVSQSRSECIYGWTAAYQITERRDCVLVVVLRIRLQPDSGVTQQQLQTARSTWEPAIEQAWTDRFRIVRTAGPCPCREYRVTVDVQWVTTGEHHTVQVHAGSGRADMGNWFLNSTGGTAAHEVGHMFGNPDEYPDPACPGRTVTSDNSIMRSSQRGQVRPRHYQGFADWISARTCCDYVVAEGRD